MAWWNHIGRSRPVIRPDRQDPQPKPERGKPRPGPSVYENRHVGPSEVEDRTEWTLLAGQDPVTGRWTWHGRYRPFGQTPFSEWRPR
jgi:hypothetical protein